MPDQLRSKEDLDESLELICLVCRQLARHGCIVPTADTDERRLVQRLHQKIRLRAELRKWFYGHNVHQGIRTVDAWVARCLEYRSLLPHRKAELGFTGRETWKMVKMRWGSC